MKRPYSVTSSASIGAVEASMPFNLLRARHDADPEGTARLIIGMADNVVPVEARGTGRSDEFATHDAYPQHWLPEV